MKGKIITEYINGIYRNIELTTLKEAKEKDHWLHYDKQIKDNQLGIIRDTQFSDFAEFYTCCI